MSQITNIKAGGGGGGSVVETLTANSGVATASANNINVVGDGVNTTTTASGNTLQVQFIGSSGGIVTIDGNTGSVTGNPVTIETTNSTVIFSGSGSTLTQNFIGDAFNNIIFGSPPPPTTAGGACVGIGINALSALTTGEFSIALGVNAMGTANASNCVCIGDGTGYFLDTNSSGNILIGFAAGNGLSEVSGPAVNNIAIGYNSGTTWLSTESNNICLGSIGVNGQNATITLGENGTHTSCFIRGIAGVDLSTANVVTESGDQLGTAVITAGSGISVTPGVNSITIASTGVTTLTGNSGTASPSAGNINIVTANTTVQFVGSGSTLTQDFSGAATNNNILMGTTATFTSAANNTSLGYNALQNLNLGVGNLALGTVSMNTADGSFNTCLGVLTGYNLDVNSVQNVLVGYNAGNGLGATGAGAVNNIAIGYDAGIFWLEDESNNICIGNFGNRFQSNTILLGTNSTHTSTFVAGIQGVTVTGTAVLVSSSDQLGVAVSSRKYKENIEDMGDISKDILNLRPVTFTLKDHEDKTTQYGLIAEEVAEVFSGLVVYDKENQPQTVKYHELPALLLNELQKSIKHISSLENRISKLEDIIRGQ